MYRPSVNVSTSLASSRLPQLTFLNRFLQWSSAVIVMGIVSYFIDIGPTGQHIIYEECISTISVAFFLPSFALTFLPKSSLLAKYSLANDVIFSYLWLTAFIFNAQDYNWHNCSINSPPGGHCSLKKAGESFTFLAFFFTIVAIFLDVAIIAQQNAGTATVPITEKPDPARGSADTEATV